MKKITPFLFVLLTFLSCKNENVLTTAPLVVNGEACEDCPKIDINIPEFIDESAASTTINTALREEIISLLTFDDETEATTIEEATFSFKKGYDETKMMFTDETTPWEATITGEITYEDKDFLSMALTSYLFTGGAHGYSSTTYLNFDKKQGTELENWELFKDPEQFEKFAETTFRKQEKVPQGAPINSTGFMFEEEIFTLPNNIGLTKEGLVLLYNQYEVASYADGPITITIPYNEVQNYLQVTLEKK